MPAIRAGGDNKENEKEVEGVDDIVEDEYKEAAENPGGGERR